MTNATNANLQSIVLEVLIGYGVPIKLAQIHRETRSRMGPGEMSLTGPVATALQSMRIAGVIKYGRRGWYLASVPCD